MRATEVDELALVHVLQGARGRAEIVARVRRAITDGLLTDGERVPATRVLATHLGIARGSVVQAYDELSGEGFLVTTPGGGTRVARAVSARGATDSDTHAEGEVPAADVRIDLRPGRPSTAGLEHDTAWRAAWRRGADAVRCDVPDLAGDPALREEIAAHVRRTRGVECAAQDIVITAGTTDAFLLMLMTLGGHGLRVGVEDPGYRYAARTARALGAEIVPIPVSDGSINPAELPRVGVVIVTPSHQYPAGGTMPVARRYALLDWARTHGAVIIEDDYDSEFRYGATPLPAITGLTPQPPAVLVGTFSKTISPSLRVGYLVIPHRPLATRVRAMRELTSIPVNQQAQDALRHFLSSGGYRRHLARMNRAYAHRRDLMLSLKLEDGLTITALEGGLHAVITWRTDAEVGERLRERLATARIAVSDLAAYRHLLDDATPEGIVLGYAAVTDLELAEALRIIAGTGEPRGA